MCRCGLDGFAVIQKLMEQQSKASADAEPMPQIVFATAYDQYAVRAFDVNAVDYLLKPLTAHAWSRPWSVCEAFVGNTNGSLPESQIESLLRLLNRRRRLARPSAGQAHRAGAKPSTADRPVDICFAAIDEA